MTAPAGNLLTFFPVTGDFQAVDDPLPQSTVSTPSLDPVQGLVKFTPRVPSGFSAFVEDYQISGDTDCVQTITLIGAITGGGFIVAFNGIWSEVILAGSAAADVQTALEGVSTIGTGNVTVTGDDGGPWQVEFTGELGSQRLTQMVANPNPTSNPLTTSSGSAYVSVVMLQPGSAARVGPASISIPNRTGRIWTNGQLCSINVEDSEGVELLANTDILNLGFDLVYDVTFSMVQVGPNSGALAPFAFAAPADSSPVCITDPALPRVVYNPPISQSWSPGWTPPVPATAMLELAPLYPLIARAS